MSGKTEISDLLFGCNRCGEKQAEWTARCVHCSPVTPAAVEVEVIGWQCNGYQFGSKENAESYWRWSETPKPIIELVSRAHVTRLTAERDALQVLLNAADQRIDELTAELAKVRLGPCKMIVGDELP
jgi:predicted ATP-dependent serine protease